MKKIASSILGVSVLVLGLTARADFESFIKQAGYGALIGAAVGVVSLSFESRPSNNLTNVTRGASLGLYAGILYAVYDSQVKEPRSNLYYQDIGELLPPPQMDTVSLPVPSPKIRKKPSLSRMENSLYGALPGASLAKFQEPNILIAPVLSRTGATEGILLTGILKRF